MKFGSGILGVEPPVDDGLGGVAFPYQGFSQLSKEINPWTGSRTTKSGKLVVSRIAGIVVED